MNHTNFALRGVYEVRPCGLGDVQHYPTADLTGGPGDEDGAHGSNPLLATVSVHPPEPLPCHAPGNLLGVLWTQTISSIPSGHANGEGGVKVQAPTG
jgi:hypothetical protein